MFFFRKYNIFTFYKEKNYYSQLVS